MASHIAYEVAALESTSEIVARTRDRFVFEAFLIHARALRDFFLGKRAKGRRRQNDALAADFVADELAWRDALGTIDQTAIHKTRAAIDRQLAHLTWDRADRLSFQNLEPYVPALTKELIEYWERFLNSVPESDARLFRESLEKRRKEVRTDPRS